MSANQAYIDKFKAQLDLWTAEINRLEAKAKLADADTRIEMDKQISALRSRRDAAQDKITELQGASEDAWDDLRTGFEDAWSSLRTGFEDAASRFQ